MARGPIALRMTSELPRISHALATGHFQISAYERCLGQDVAMHGFLERGFAGLAQIRKQGIEGKEPTKGVIARRRVGRSVLYRLAAPEAKALAKLLYRMFCKAPVATRRASKRRKP
jgi:hypothetical protein